MPRVLHTICYTKIYNSWDVANSALTRLSKCADFVGATIEHEEMPISGWESLIEMLSPILLAMLASKDPSVESLPAAIPNEPRAILQVFFLWDENIYLPRPYLPENCDFTVIPEALRDEYGIMPSIQFTEAYEGIPNSTE